jgi:polyisoprenoid-binding protein YceI
MKRFLLSAALLAGFGLAQAQTLVPAGSEIVFVSKQMGVPVEGRFKTFSLPGFAFNPKQPQAAKVQIGINLASASMGAADVEAELMKPEWLDSKRQPNASFTAQSVKALGGGKFELSGPFTLKGQTKPLTVQLTLTQAGANSTATGQFNLKRTDWKIGDGEWSDTSIVAADVLVKFKFQFSGMAPL